MNIEEINRRHFFETDMYHRVGYGISSKLIDFSKGFFTLEVVISNKWTKNYNTTAQELSELWKEAYHELKYAVGCKVFIIDTRQFPYKQFLIHRGIRPGYDSKKGILFKNNYLN